MQKIEDILELTRYVRKKHVKIIGVDGSLGAGKSSLIAPALKIALGAPIIHLDRYLHRHAGSYFNTIRKEQLKDDIWRTLFTHHQVIVEGILLMKVLHSLHIYPGIVIYACDSFWLSQWKQYKHDRESAKRIVHEEELMTNRVQRIFHPKWKFKHFNHVTKELYEYTHDYKPFQSANCLFLIDKYIS